MADRVVRPYRKCFDVILSEAKNLFGAGYRRYFGHEMPSE